MRLALFVNPSSGGGTDPGVLAARLRDRGADVALHPFAAIADASLDGVDRLVVATGDGGLGPAAARAAAAGLAVGVLPSGTANDLAAFLGLPEDAEHAAALAADPSAAMRPLDVGWSGRVPFVNAAACGLSVAAAGHARPLKDALGPAAYAVGALRAGLTEAACWYRVRMDGVEVFAGAAWQIIVSGTGAFGNGAEVEPADPADARLDVTVLTGESWAALPLRAWGMRRGGLVDQAGVEHHRGRTVEVEGAEAWNVDGERCDRSDAGRFRLDGRVDIVVPGPQPGCAGPVTAPGAR